MPKHGSAPTVSVLLATYDGERHLAALLASLRAQTRPPEELVVCDDRSSDATTRVVRSFALDAPFPVRLHENAVNLGFNRNFLTGVGRCEGELISFCDQDDVWDPRKLELCQTAFDDPDVLLASHAAHVVDERLRPVGITVQDVRRTQTVGRLGNDPFFTPLGFSLMCRASLPRRISWQTRPRSPNGGLGEPQDFDEWVGFLANVFGKTVLLSERLTLYRQHAASYSGIPVSSKLAVSVRVSARTGLAAYQSRAELAREYAAYLRERAGSADLPDRDPMLQAAGAYDAVALRWDRRAALYATRPVPLAGVPQLLELVAKRDYRRRRGGGLGLRALQKDAFVAVTGRRPG